jgi:antitoxin component YwqK of YwqJK toxin-antitoxin module
VKKHLISACLVAWLLFCPALPAYAKKPESKKMSSINLLDRNGLSQTISAKNRLSEYEQTDFLSPQPYQKVMRVYSKEKNGDIPAIITSYHPNGQIKQYLEAVNNRAYGTYCEWYQNGQVKIQATVIGGMADLNTQAESSWLFNGLSWAWDEEGHFLAEIVYDKGMLDGDSRYFHPTGYMWKNMPYHQGTLHGTSYTYLDNGELLQQISYEKGEKEGRAYRYWSKNQLAFDEWYEQGLLMKGAYYAKNGNKISEIQQGCGHKVIFGKSAPVEKQEYREGRQEGVVEIYDERQNLTCQFSLKESQKHGEELAFYPRTKKPKISISWEMGELKGPIKTWYDNGALESEREMNRNLKNGLLTAWYRNGSLMLMEEYEDDKLIKGEYFKSGDPLPVSRVEHGKGLATLYTAEGNFNKKVFYQEGYPIE